MKTFLTCLLITTFCFYADAQQNVGIGTNNPHSSAILDVESSTKGILIPRVTTQQRTGIQNPAQGLLVYDNDQKVFYQFDGTAWKIVGSKWSDQNNNIYFSTGKVGIQTQNPTQSLDVNGAVRIGTTTVNNAGSLRFENGTFEGHDGNSWKSLTDTGIDSELEKITEANNAGWRLKGRDTANYGNIGFEAIDFSYQQSPSQTRGATGIRSMAWGENTKASGLWNATAWGWNTQALENEATAWGSHTAAEGINSTCFGDYTKAKSAFETVFGRYNTDYDPVGPNFWSDFDRLLVVGNGIASNLRKDALILYKDGTLKFQNFLSAPATTTDRFYILNNQVHYNGEKLNSSQLELITENNNTGWRLLGKNPAHYGNIGFGAVDFSTSTLNSETKGATGAYSLACGQFTTASGVSAASFGILSEANGPWSTCLGVSTLAQSGAELVIGRYNTEYQPILPNGWNENDRLFVIGNGNGIGSRNDALRVYKNGLIETFSTQNKKAIQFKNAEGDQSKGVITLYNDEGHRTIRLDGQFADENHGNIRLYDGVDDANIKIQISANWGNTGYSRIVTDEIQINGGADLAEHFEVKKTLLATPEPGMVVSIDPENPGQLALSSLPYDHKVAGVISGGNGIKPGMMMGQKGSFADGEYPVALTGRVYVLTNEEEGKIEPGDLLTSSSTPGQAMKAVHLEKSRGSIIGKAMTRPDENNYVLVLVNLQ